MPMQNKTKLILVLLGLYITALVMPLHIIFEDISEDNPSCELCEWHVNQKETKKIPELDTKTTEISFHFFDSSVLIPVVKFSIVKAPPYPDLSFRGPPVLFA